MYNAKATVKYVHQLQHVSVVSMAIIYIHKIALPFALNFNISIVVFAIIALIIVNIAILTLIVLLVQKDFI